MLEEESTRAFCNWQSTLECGYSHGTTTRLFYPGVSMKTRFNQSFPGNYVEMVCYWVRWVMNLRGIHPYLNGTGKDYLYVKGEFKSIVSNTCFIICNRQFLFRILCVRDHTAPDWWRNRCTRRESCNAYCILGNCMLMSYASKQSPMNNKYQLCCMYKSMWLRPTCVFYPTISIQK